MPATSSSINFGIDLPSFGQVLRGRLEPGRGERPGRPSDPCFTLQRKLSMSKRTLATLEAAAEKISTPERRVSPMQIAALLLEEAVQGIAEQLEKTHERGR